MHSGEVGTEIAPALAVDADPAMGWAVERVDQLLRRTCELARALTGAEQAALKLDVEGAPELTRKYFSLSAAYAAWRDYQIDPQGLGLHGLDIPAGQVIRLTQAEVEAHPAWQAFGYQAASRPPLRGWLATPVCGDGGRKYGLLQLSDKTGDSDFDERDEELILELVAVVGAALDAVREAHAHARRLASPDRSRICADPARATPRAQARATTSG
jgi:GAF domain-containing protein